MDLGGVGELDGGEEMDLGWRKEGLEDLGES